MFKIQLLRRNPEICFVVSAPRSGSTWLQTALNFHPWVFSTEHRLFGKFFEVWPNGDGTYSPRITLDKYTDILADYYQHDALGVDRMRFKRTIQREFMKVLVAFARQNSKCKLIVDKITPYRGTAMAVVTSISEYFPASKIVFLLRDGRDVLTSGVFDWMKRQDEGTPRYDHFVNKNRNINLSRFFTDSDIATWTEYWKEPLDAMDDYSVFTHRIRFEDMKADHQAELAKLFAFLGLPASRRILEKCVTGSSFESMSKGRKPGQMEPTEKVRKGVPGDWKNFFTKRDGELFLELTGRRLVECGYESDDSWIETLPDDLST